ncbi:MAG: aminotransferase class I/II-fold pyridoxal phosphate-dependent enzyme [Gemmiger sp.]|nr:aminotransferase class I/II-fold pyridoxal phosphate-dependent enzyme [Gemmiger sp.]
MLRFECDYGEGAAPQVLALLGDTNLEQTPGYGEDAYCAKAAAQIRTLCQAPNAAVHFFVGATQANLTVIDAALRPWQGVLCAESGHIHVHETGAVEATGHKCLALPAVNGKITAAQVKAATAAHRANPSHEHEVQPGMVYISNPTEDGTLYTKAELAALAAACREAGLYLFVDGARMAYGLTAPGNDLTLPDYAPLCDVFYLGGTKCGALFGEALVVVNPALQTDFRYAIKQHGGMLAKGRLLGLQFLALLAGETGSGNSPYYTLARRANKQAAQLAAAFAAKGCAMLYPSPTNQQFPILPETALAALAKNYSFTDCGAVDATHRAARFCTSWATRQQDVDALVADIAALAL